MKTHKIALYFILAIFAIVAVFLIVMTLIECSKALTRPGHPAAYHEATLDDSDDDSEVGGRGPYNREYTTTKRKPDGKNKQF